MNYSFVTALVALVVAIGGFLYTPQVKPDYGSTGSRFPNGLSTNATLPSAGQIYTTTLNSTGAATIGGTLTVTTSNTATSTTVVGCVQTYATSTATPISMAFLAVATATTNMLNSQSNNGFVVWEYGACPH